MTVDDLLQVAVRIIADIAMMVEYHQFAALFCIWLPSRQAFNIGIARMGELRPRTAHHISQAKVVGSRLRHDVLGLMQTVEAETEFIAVNGTQTDGRTPSEHIHVELRVER